MKEVFFWYDARTDEVKEALTTEAFMDTTQVFWSRELLDVKNYRTNLLAPADHLSYEQQCEMHQSGELNMDREGP